MNWLYLSFLSIIFRALFSIALKIQSNQANVSPITHSVLLTSLGALFALIISPLIGGIFLNEILDVWLITLIMIISQVIGNILYFKGLEKLDAGTTQIALSSILIWNTALSVIFLNSNFSIKQIIGIIFLMFAILIVQYSKGRNKLTSHIVYIILSAVAFAIFQVTTALLANTMSTATYLFLSYFGAMILTIVLYYKKVATDIQTIKNNSLIIGRNAVFVSGTSITFLLFLYYAFQSAPDKGVVAVLQTSQVVLTVIFGIIFLKEYGGMKRKLLAGIIALIAGILIKS